MKQLLNLEGEAREIALPLRRGDGSELPTLLNASLADDGLVYAAIFDATGRHEFERDLLRARRDAEAAAERVRVLQQASFALSVAASEDAVAAELSAQARAAFAAARVVVLFVDEGGELRLAAGEHPDGDTAPVWWPFEAAITGDGPVVVESLDAAADHPGLAERLRAARLEALTATPIAHEGVDLGVLVCLYGRARRIDPAAIELQEALSAIAAEVLIRLRLQRRLEHLALHDQLTGLANRTAMFEHVSRAMAETRRSGRPFGLIFVDLDAFKAINDRYGHVAGDGVLTEVARRIRGAIRDGDLAGRHGGDEFVVAIRDVDAGEAQAVAERIRLAIAEPIGGIELPLTASVGVTMFTADRWDAPPDVLLDRADAAMYDAKAAGKDAVRFA
jgi:diguanylate cyclase (GGDEF)-like protein